MVDTSDEWIRERTGMSRRRVAGPDESTTDLAVRAAERALAAAGAKPSDVDGIIVATITCERTMPSAACIVQSKLGCPQGLAFDVSAACSGFLYALSLADALVQTGRLRNCLVVGAESLSRIIDYRDRETCILFGDGAGAMFIAPSPAGVASRFHSFHHSANGALGDLLTLESPSATGGPFVEPLVEDIKKPFVHMRGREIFKNAVNAMRDRCLESLRSSGLSAGDIDWFIAHQANVRIIDVVRDQLGVSPERVVVNLSEVGNTSSASIPIAFDECVRDGRVQRGQTVLLAAFGGGLTSASILLKY